MEEMERLKLTVPTYNGGRLNEPNCNLPEFDDPEVPVLVHAAEGVRVVLGTHDYHDYHKPDIQIERRHNGWVIFLHPDGGDPSGYVFFLDDGRSFVVSEYGRSGIEFAEYEEIAAEVDKINPEGNSCVPPIIIQHPQRNNGM